MTAALQAALSALAGAGAIADVAPDSTPTILGYVPWALPVIGLALLWLVRARRPKAPPPHDTA